MKNYYYLAMIFIAACHTNSKNEISEDAITAMSAPLYVTETVAHDSDDPAIWINKQDLSKSLILGTDKMENNQGGVYVFDLKGKVDTILGGIDRPNNIDVAYNFSLGEDSVDVAIFTERIKAQVRIFSLPDMQYIDGGGIKVFEDDPYNAVMGVAFYQNPETMETFFIVSRKENPDQNSDYLYQYQLISKDSIIGAELVRKFGEFEGSTEIEAIAVDHQLGYIYYSDEGYGIRKYYADPSKGNQELAVFGLDGFTQDREGISIYQTNDTTGYIIVSNQQAGTFNVYPREGTVEDEHEHKQIGTLNVEVNESDGSEVTHLALNDDYPKGLFVAMSDNKTFEIYSWEELVKQLR